MEMQQQQPMMPLRSLKHTPGSYRMADHEPAYTETYANMMTPGSAEVLQDDFTLLDLIGGAGIAVMHPTKPIVAYTSGCIIIVFDLMSDTKIQLTSHEHEVHALAFTPAGAGGLPGTGGDYLISIDFNRNEPNEDNGPLSRLFVWDWRQGQCLQQVRIPCSQSPSLLGAQQVPSVTDLRSNKQLRLYQIVFDKAGSTFVVLESSNSDVGGGYRVSVWNFNRAQAVGLVAHDDLELQTTCLGIQMLQNQVNQTTLSNPLYNTATKQVTINRADGNSQLAQVYLTNTIKFLTVEKSSIKIWQMSQGVFELQKRIHIKQVIRQCVLSELTGFMLILGMNGKVLILDSKGEFVSTVSKQGIFFTEIGTCDDRLLLGTEKGTVHAYHIASLQFISEIPYQIALLPDNCLNREPLRATQQLGMDRPLNKMEEALIRVGPAVTRIQTTKDKRFLMVSYKDSSFAVIDRTVVSSMADAILGFQYGHFESITGLQWLGSNNSKLGSDQYQLIHQANECFATASSDLSVYIWRHFGDRWNTQFIDIAKCYDKSLSYQRKNCDKSTDALKLTALQVMPRRQTLAVADNRGTLRIFQLSPDSAQLVSTHQLQKSPEMLEDCTTSVQSIYFTHDESLAVITYDNGLISTYDVRGGFTWLGDIEKAVPRVNQISTNTFSKILERNEMRDDPRGGYLVNQFRPVTSSQSKFSVFSLRGPNCVKQQIVEVTDNRIGMTPLTQFFIDDGKVSGFDIHPSKDYILITSSKGKIYVFRIDTGELRGTIDVPLHAQGCVIDPSGLYVVVKVPPFSPRHTSNLTNKPDDFSSMGLNERDLCRTTILMYEVGTRRVAAEVHSIFDITQMNFSGDGRYLALGSKKGAVSVWALGDHMFKTVNDIIQRMNSQQDFWCNYPIYLSDHQQTVSRATYGGVVSHSTLMPQTPMQRQNFLEDPIGHSLRQHKDKIATNLDRVMHQTQPQAQQQFGQDRPFAPQHVVQQQQNNNLPSSAQKQQQQRASSQNRTMPRNLEQNRIPQNTSNFHESHADQIELVPTRQMAPTSAAQRSAMAQFAPESNPAAANENQRLREVEMYSQDLQPSNMAAQNHPSEHHNISVQPLTEDQSNNEQRFMRNNYVNQSDTEQQPRTAPPAGEQDRPNFTQKQSEVMSAQNPDVQQSEIRLLEQQQQEEQDRRDAADRGNNQQPNGEHQFNHNDHSDRESRMTRDNKSAMEQQLRPESRQRSVSDNAAAASRRDSVPSSHYVPQLSVKNISQQDQQQVAQEQNQEVQPSPTNGIASLYRHQNARDYPLTAEFATNAAPPEQHRGYDDVQRQQQLSYPQMQHSTDRTRTIRYPSDDEIIFAASSLDTGRAAFGPITMADGSKVHVPYEFAMEHGLVAEQQHPPHSQMGHSMRSRDPYHQQHQQHQQPQQAVNAFGETMPLRQKSTSRGRSGHSGSNPRSTAALAYSATGGPLAEMQQYHQNQSHRPSGGNLREADPHLRPHVSTPQYPGQHIAHISHTNQQAFQQHTQKVAGLVRIDEPVDIDAGVSPRNPNPPAPIDPPYDNNGQHTFDQLYGHQPSAQPFFTDNGPVYPGQEPHQPHLQASPQFQASFSQSMPKAPMTGSRVQFRQEMVDQSSNLPGRIHSGSGQVILGHGANRALPSSRSPVGHLPSGHLSGGHLVGNQMIRGDSEIDRVYNEVDDFERRMTHQQQRISGSTIGSQALNPGNVYGGSGTYGGGLGRQEEPNMRQSHAPQRAAFRNLAGQQRSYM